MRERENQTDKHSSKTNVDRQAETGIRFAIISERTKTNVQQTPGPRHGRLNVLRVLGN